VIPHKKNTRARSLEKVEKKKVRVILGLFVPVGNFVLGRSVLIYKEECCFYKGLSLLCIALGVRMPHHSVTVA